jgi:hypothetical protein
VIWITDQGLGGTNFLKAERARAAHSQKSIEVESDAIRSTPTRLRGAGTVAVNFACDTHSQCASLRPFLLYIYFCNVRIYATADLIWSSVSLPV